MTDHSPHLTLTLQPEHFEQVRLGRKRVEGRIAKSKYLALKRGERLLILEWGGQRKVWARCEGITRYFSFLEMLEGETLMRCLPNAQALEEGVQMYRAFPGYLAGERDLGVVAITLAVIET